MVNTRRKQKLEDMAKAELSAPAPCHVSIRDIKHESSTSPTTTTAAFDLSRFPTSTSPLAPSSSSYSSSSGDQVSDASMSDDDDERAVTSSTTSAFMTSSTSSSSSHHSRELMRPWLRKQIELGGVPGLQWMDKEKTKVKIPWTHGSRHGFDANKDSCLFKRWAKHTGKCREDTPNAPKRWKANFRCAMNSLPDVEEVKDQSKTRGHTAYKVYKFLPCKKSAGGAGGNKMAAAAKRRRENDISNSQQKNYSTNADRKDMLRQLKEKLQSKQRTMTVTETSDYISGAEDPEESMDQGSFPDYVYAAVSAHSPDSSSSGMSSGSSPASSPEHYSSNGYYGNNSSGGVDMTSYSMVPTVAMTSHMTSHAVTQQPAYYGVTSSTSNYTEHSYAANNCITEAIPRTVEGLQDTDGLSPFDNSPRNCVNQAFESISTLLLQNNMYAGQTNVSTTKPDPSSATLAAINSGFDGLGWSQTPFTNNATMNLSTMPGNNASNDSLSLATKSSSLSAATNTHDTFDYGSVEVGGNRSPDSNTLTYGSVEVGNRSPDSGICEEMLSSSQGGSSMQQLLQDTANDDLSMFGTDYPSAGQETYTEKVTVQHIQSINTQEFTALSAKTLNFDQY